jgi:hypothetical protein
LPVFESAGDGRIERHTKEEECATEVKPHEQEQDTAEDTIQLETACNLRIEPKQEPE